jgi:hypothetical protein
MTRTNNIFRFAGIVLLLLLLVPPSRTFAAEDRHLDKIHLVLEASTLSRTEQAGVNTKAAAAITAGLPGDDVEIIVSRAVGHGADAVLIGRLLDTAMSAKKEGLPVQPVLDRMEQGLAKGVPTERVVAASQRLAEKIATALPLVDALIREGMTPRRGNERETAIGSAARALEKSMNTQDIAAMGAAVRNRRGSLSLFTSAMDTAAYFAASGMSPKTAMHLVRDAVQKGSSEHDLGAMVRRMDNEMKHGTSAEDAAANMERGNMQGDRDMERQDMRQEMRTNPEKGSGSGMGGYGR